MVERVLASERCDLLGVASREQRPHAERERTAEDEAAGVAVRAVQQEMADSVYLRYLPARDGNASSGESG
jgi:hypothetical protein